MVDKQIAAALAEAGAKPAKPADAFGDPDRRRGMVSFLTWAFFLSEAFKGIQAEAAGLKATDALDPASSGASSADGPAQDQPSDAASLKTSGRSPCRQTRSANFRSPAIRHPSRQGPPVISLARGRFDVPSAYGGGGGGETHGAVHGTSGSVETRAGIHTEAGNPLVDVGLHLEPGDELGLNVGLSLPSGGETLQGILGSPVLALEAIVVARPWCRWCGA